MSGSRRAGGWEVAAYAARRLVFLPVGLLLVLTASFVISNIVPSDPVHALVGDLATPEQVAQARAELHLDDPLWLRFVRYLDGLVQGDLGTSYYSHHPVLSELLGRLPSTLELVVLALVVAFAYGVGLGSIGAYADGRAGDRITGAIVAIHQAVPDFVVAIVGSLIGFYALRLLPAPIGQLDIAVVQPPAITGAAGVDAVLAGDFVALQNAGWHLIMPVVALAVFSAVPFAKTSRATMGEALSAPYSDFARASGLSERQVFWGAFKASRGPILTYTALVAAGLVGGDAIIETIFSWHGVGQWAVASILQRDLPSVQGFVLLTGTITLVVYFAVDLCLIFLDPRVRRRAT